MSGGWGYVRRRKVRMFLPMVARHAALFLPPADPHACALQGEPVFDATKGHERGPMA